MNMSNITLEIPRLRILSCLRVLVGIIDMYFMSMVGIMLVESHPYGSQSKHGAITQFCFNVVPASSTINRQ